MFHWLNRIVRGVIILGWCAAAYGVWTQRERARPAVDYYALFRDADWQRPPPLPRWNGEFVRMVSPGLVELVDERGAKWRFGLQGLATVNPDLPPHAPTNRWFLKQNYTNLMRELKGASLEIGVISTNLDRTGVGFLYRTNHLAHVDWVETGRYRLRPQECRMLPLPEQYALRLADREARRTTAGIWRLPGAVQSTGGEPTP
jgi:hypothetical protein